MNNQQDNPSGLYQTASNLGAALGVAAVIFFAPVVFGWTRASIYAGLLVNFGATLAELLTWVMGGIEAYVIFCVCKIVLTFVIAWGMTALASRGLR